VDDNVDSAGLGEEDLVGDVDGEDCKDSIMVGEDDDCGEVCDDDGVGAEDHWDVDNSGKAVDAVSEDDGK